ncbi:MAG: hypothetical protein WC144_06780 [Sulfurimonas sp.]|jgi:hypothetical protein
MNNELIIYDNFLTSLLEDHIISQDQIEKVIEDNYKIFNNFQTLLYDRISNEISIIGLKKNDTYYFITIENLIIDSFIKQGYKLIPFISFLNNSYNLIDNNYN